MGPASVNYFSSRPTFNIFIGRVNRRGEQLGADADSSTHTDAAWLDEVLIPVVIPWGSFIQGGNNVFLNRLGVVVLWLHPYPPPPNPVVVCLFLCYVGFFSSLRFCSLFLTTDAQSRQLGRISSTLLFIATRALTLSETEILALCNYYL